MREDEHFALLIPPVKNAERTREKIREARKEFSDDVSRWPLVEMIGDLLRASVVDDAADDAARAGRADAGREAHARAIRREPREPRGA